MGFLNIHGLHDVRPINGIKCCMHAVKVCSIYIVSRGVVWFEGRIARQMKINAYMIAISQAREIINVINHISFICKYQVKQAGSSARSKTSWFLYVYKRKKSGLATRDYPLLSTMQHT